MDFKQLEAFVQVVKLGSFSKAADSIFLSQPTISHQIRTLEKELGTPLLIRSTREVKATKAGQEFLQYARNLLSLRDRALESVRGRNHSVQEEFDIVASSIPAQYILPQAIANFHKRYPNLLVRIHPTKDLRLEPEDEIYELRIGGEAGEEMPQYMQLPFHDEPWVLVLSSQFDIDHEIIEANLQDFIKSQGFLLWQDDQELQDELNHLLFEYGLNLKSLRQKASFPNLFALLQAVAGGIGISIVPKIAVTMHFQSDALQTIDMTHHSRLLKYCLHIKKEHLLSSSQEAFINYLCSFYYHKKELSVL